MGQPSPQNAINHLNLMINVLPANENEAQLPPPPPPTPATPGFGMGQNAAAAEDEDHGIFAGQLAKQVAGWETLLEQFGGNEE